METRQNAPETKYVKADFTMWTHSRLIPHVVETFKKK